MSRIGIASLFGLLIPISTGLPDTQTQQSGARASKGCAAVPHVKTIRIKEGSNDQANTAVQPGRPTVQEIRTSGPLESPSISDVDVTNQPVSPVLVEPVGPPPSSEENTSKDVEADSKPESVPLPFYSSDPPEPVPGETAVPKSVIKPVEFQSDANKAKAYSPDPPTSQKAPKDNLPSQPPKNAEQPVPLVEPEALEFSPNKTVSPWVIRIEVVQETTLLVASSKNAEFKVECRHLKVQSPAGDIQAEGDVLVRVMGLTMSCQKMVITWKDDWVALEGDVRVTTHESDNKMELVGEKLRLKLTKLIATSGLKSNRPMLYESSYFEPSVPANVEPSPDQPMIQPYYERVTED